MLFYWEFVKYSSHRFRFAARLVKFFLLISFISFILANICFYILKNILFGVGLPLGCTGTIPEKEGGVHVLASLAQSIQGVGYLIRTSLAAQPTAKMIVLILIFIYLQTYIFDLGIRQTWLWFGTNGQMQHLNILAIQPVQI